MTTSTHGAGSFLGSRDATGALSTASSQFPNPYGVGKWSTIFTPAILAFSSTLVQCYHIALTGPGTGSNLKLFIDNTFYDTTPNGDLNSYDPQNPLILRGGQSLNFHWDVSTGVAPFVTTWWKVPVFGGG